MFHRLERFEVASTARRVTALTLNWRRGGTPCTSFRCRRTPIILSSADIPFDSLALAQGKLSAADIHRPSRVAGWGSFDRPFGAPPAVTRLRWLRMTVGWAAN